MIEIVQTASFTQDGLVVIDKLGAVWLTHVRPWYDIGAQLRWALMPGEKAWLVLKTVRGRVRVQAVRLASNYVRMC